MQTTIFFVTLIFIAVIGAGSGGRDYGQFARPIKSKPSIINHNGAAYAQDVVCETTDRYIIACPPDHTCCRLVNGEYGCCPVPNAVCCSDGVNCCPSGYTCSVSTGECHKRS